jgi:hypothetical protein
MIRTGAPGSVDRGRGGDEGLSRPECRTSRSASTPWPPRPGSLASPAAHTERSNLADGLITSLARPRGNVTGAILDTAEVTEKRLELLKEALPGLRGARGSLALTANNVTYGLLGERLGYTPPISPRVDALRQRPTRPSPEVSAGVPAPAGQVFERLLLGRGLPLELHQIPVSAPITASCTGIAGWPDWRRAPVRGEGDSKT